MKTCKRIFLLVLFLPLCVYSQDITPAKIDTTIKANLLLAPESIGSNLVGIAASEIQKPSEVSDLVLQLQNATQNFTKIPSSFALDFAPGRKNMKVEDWIKNKNLFCNSFVFSLGIKSATDTKQAKDSTQVGLGFKFSVIRGKFKEETIKQLDALANNLIEISEKQHDIQRIINQKLDRDTTCQRLTAEREQLNKTEEGVNSTRKKQIDDTLKIIREKTVKELNDNIKQQKVEINNLAKETINELNEIKFRRYGGFLDLVAGLALNFPEQVFSKGSVYKQAVWLNGGYEYECGLSILGLFRYQYNPDKVFADDKNTLKTTNVHTIDVGGKLYFSKEASKFSISSEYIYRSVLNNDLVKPSWRFTINASYELQKNILLVANFGRDFDKTIYKDGNVIAALNFITGFGNSRSIKN